MRNRNSQKHLTGKDYSGEFCEFWDLLLLLLLMIFVFGCKWSLEKDSGIYFNMKYFEEAVMSGDWDEVEKYLSKFTKLDDNSYSAKTFLGIRKQKYLEALDK